MKANCKFVAVLGGLCLGCGDLTMAGSPNTSIESSSIADPNILAAIFTPAPSQTTPTLARPVAPDPVGPADTTQVFQLPVYRTQIPRDWEDFDKKFSPEQHPGQPALQLLENGLYQVNQTIFSVKLFERKVNSMMNFEYTLSDIAGYDSRTKANRIDSFFSNASLKSDFNWEAPVGLYVGFRFEIRCNSIFQFWK